MPVFVALLFQFEQKPVISFLPVPADEFPCFRLYHRHLFLMEMKGLTFAFDSTRKNCETKQGKRIYYSQNLGIRHAYINALADIEN
jgi:hypothetical protein